MRSARRGRSGPLTVAFAPVPPSSPPDPPRVAFAVGRKVGGAVVRNRLRRRLRSLLVEMSPSLSGTLLVSTTAAAAGLPYHRLGEHLDRALHRAGALQ